MVYLSTLTDGLQKFCVYQQTVRTSFERIEQIRMLEPNQRIQPYSIYLCDEQTALDFFTADSPCTDFILFISSSRWDPSLRPPAGCSLIVIDRPLPTLFNCLADNLKRLHDINRTLERIHVSKNHVQRLLQTAIDLVDFEGYFYLLTPSFQVTAAISSRKASSTLPGRLPVDSYLSHGQIRQCLQSCTEDRSFLCERQSRVFYQTYPLADHKLLAYLMVYGIPCCFGLPELLDRICELLPSFLEAENEETIGEQKKLSQIMEDVFLSPNSNIDWLRSRLSECPERLGFYIRSILFSFDNDKVSAQQFISDLKLIFPTRNITVYENKIVIWLSGTSGMFLPEFDHQALENLLERYHSYCIISNAGRFVRGLRTLYIQCKEMLELLPQMNFFLKGRRFVYFEEISAYYMIHICSLALENHYGHNKLVYLAGPASMEVIRYDRAHGTDLLNFLYEYLESGCSIADTAERLHMHRNTVNNRIKKVEECIGVDIRNPQVCLELTNSCRIMMYAEHVSQQEYNIELQKTEQSSLKQKLSPAIFFLYSTEPVLLQNNSPQAIQTDTIPATGSQNCKDLSPVLEYLSESPVGL